MGAACNCNGTPRDESLMACAPIRLGDGATIGGGSTISKDAPAGQLTVARGKQMSLAGWKRPVRKK